MYKINSEGMQRRRERLTLGDIAQAGAPEVMSDAQKLRNLKDAINRLDERIR